MTVSKNAPKEGDKVLYEGLEKLHVIDHKSSDQRGCSCMANSNPVTLREYCPYLVAEVLIVVQTSASSNITAPEILTMTALSQNIHILASNDATRGTSCQSSNFLSNNLCNLGKVQALMQERI